MAAACPGLTAALLVQAGSSDIVCARAAPASSVLLNLWKKSQQKLRGNFDTVMLNGAEREALGGKGETRVPKHGLKAAQGCSSRKKTTINQCFLGCADVLSLGTRQDKAGTAEPPVASRTIGVI